MFLYNNLLCLLTIINIHRRLLYLKFFDLYSYEKSYKLSCPIRPMSIHSNISTRWINKIFYLFIYPIQFLSHMIYKIYSTPYSTISSNLFTILLYSSRDIPICFLLLSFNSKSNVWISKPLLKWIFSTSSKLIIPSDTVTILFPYK